ncbi:uncharacterized protein PRCAT00006001001 [Priceomyces carsonii]|uniref:uncharacterized protein n=1 Tax=Priceomyces carsonii TaxID=28549 RepID=UPI002ED7E8FD|nr:unnamed protein product [Priceomyces carsonii]
MIRFVGRYRLLRYRQFISTRSFHLSLNCFLGKKNERSYLDSTSQQLGSVKDVISSYVIDFFKNETRSLTDALKKDDASMVKYENDIIDDPFFRGVYSTLDLLIKKELQSTVDKYNRFSLLLTYDPIRINPHVYICLYKDLKVDLDSGTKMLFLRRLIFHNRFSECWDVILANNSTLQDIEESIDVMENELEENHSIKIGIYYLLLASQKAIPNITLARTVADTICFKFDISKSDLQQLITNEKALASITTFEDLVLYREENLHLIENSIVMRLFYLRRIIRILLSVDVKDAALYSQILNEFKQFAFTCPECFKTGGWITSILPASTYLDLKNELLMAHESLIFDDLSNFILHSLRRRNRAALSVYDILLLSQSSRASFACVTYKLYRDNFQSQKSLNRTIINWLMDKIIKNSDTQEVFKIAYENTALIDETKMVDSIIMLFEGNEMNFKKLVKRISSDKEKANKVFIGFMEKTLGKGTTYDQVVTLTDAFYRSKLSSELIIKLLHLLSNTNIDKQKLNKYFLWLLKDLKLSSYVLLEVMRCCVLRLKLFDETLLSELFGAILERSIDKRIVNDSQTVDDFQSLYSAATVKEKARFHNRIRALAQCLSLLEVGELGRILNLFHEHTFSSEFQFIWSQSGKNYIFNSLIIDTMRFISRSFKDSGEGILKMRNLLATINFDSSLVKCCLFRYMVISEPSMCFKLLQFHHDRDEYLTKDAIRYIISGILNTKLEDKKKLELFQSFHLKLDSFNYGYSISRFTAVELINVLIGATEKDPNKSLESIKWVLGYAKKKKLPKGVFLRWAKKFN